MAERKIIHIDMDAFFAAVEQRDEPAYRGKPVIVGGRPEDRGVVATASYEARRFGIHSAMSSAAALRLCPQAIFLPPRFRVYRHVSNHVMGILKRHSPVLEAVSVDEAYLDVTEAAKGLRYARKIAQEIKEQIRRETGLTASAGVGPNKLIAKIASDYKKPDGLTVVTPERAQQFLDKLPVRKIPGIGGVAEQKLAALGVRTVQQLRERSKEELEALFGKTGEWYYQAARGEDEREVVVHREVKSVGCERTFPSDIVLRSDLEKELMQLAQELHQRASKKACKAHCLTLKITFFDFSKITRSVSSRQAITQEWEIYEKARALLAKTEAGKRPVRLLGIALSSLEEGSDPQLSFPF